MYGLNVLHVQCFPCSKFQLHSTVYIHRSNGIITLLCVTLDSYFYLEEVKIIPVTSMKENQQRCERKKRLENYHNYSILKIRLCTGKLVIGQCILS